MSLYSNANESDTSLPVGGYGSLAVALGANGNIHVADPLRNRIHRVTPQGTASVVAGRPPADASAAGEGPRIAELDLPQGLAVGRDGALYVSVRSGLVRLVLP